MLAPVLFKKIDQSLMNTTELRFWKRIIDDGIGIWKGSKRAFETFVKRLNKETNRYGINFLIAEIQYGKLIKCLDVPFCNLIQFKSRCNTLLNPIKGRGV